MSLYFNIHLECNTDMIFFATEKVLNIQYQSSTLRTQSNNELESNWFDAKEREQGTI